MADLSQSSSTAVHAVGRARAAADDVREAANSCKLSSLRDEGHSIALKAQEILSHIEERVRSGVGQRAPHAAQLVHEALAQVQGRLVTASREYKGGFLSKFKASLDSSHKKSFKEAHDKLQAALRSLDSSGDVTHADQNTSSASAAGTSSAGGAPALASTASSHMQLQQQQQLAGCEGDMPLHLRWDRGNQVGGVGLVTIGMLSNKPHLWVGLRSSTEFYPGCGSMRTHSQPADKGQSVTSMLCDPSNNCVWTGHADGTIMLHADGTWGAAKYRTQVGAAIRALAVDSRHDCWAGDDAGVIYMLHSDRGSPRIVLRKVDVPPPAAKIWSQAADRAGGSSSSSSGGGATGGVPVAALLGRGSVMVSSGGYDRNYLTLWNSQRCEKVEHCNTQTYGPALSLTTVNWQQQIPGDAAAAYDGRLLLAAGELSSWRLLSGHDSGQVLVWQVHGLQARHGAAAIAPLCVILEPRQLSPIKHITLFEDFTMMVLADASGVLAVTHAPTPAQIADVVANAPPNVIPGAPSRPRWVPIVARIRAHKSPLVAAASAEEVLITASAATVKSWTATQLKLEAQGDGLMFRSTRTLSASSSSLSNAASGATAANAAAAAHHQQLYPQQPQLQQRLSGYSGLSGTDTDLSRLSSTDGMASGGSGSTREAAGVGGAAHPSSDPAAISGRSGGPGQPQQQQQPPAGEPSATQPAAAAGGNRPGAVGASSGRFVAPSASKPNPFSRAAVEKRGMVVGPNNRVVPAILRGLPQHEAEALQQAVAPVMQMLTAQWQHPGLAPFYMQQPMRAGSMSQGLYPQEASRGLGAAAGSGDQGGGNNNGLTEAGSIKPCDAIRTEHIITCEELELNQPIGIGAEGKVYRGKWCNIDIAAKEYLAVEDGESAEMTVDGQPTEAAKQRAQNALLKEVGLLGKLMHPNLVRFCGVCLDPPLVVMEYYRFGSVYKMLESARAAVAQGRSNRCVNYLSWKRRLDMLHDVASGMMYLHSRRYVHGDLRSPNLFVTEHGRVKIGDFGFTKRLKRSKETIKVGRITHPRWVAPELLNAYELSTSADVYSFGIIMYEVLTFKIPFEECAKAMVAIQVLAKEMRPQIPSFEKLPPNTSRICLANYIRLMEECWAQDPKKRPSFSTVARRLKAMQRWYWACTNALRLSSTTVKWQAARANSGGGKAADVPMAVVPTPQPALAAAGAAAAALPQPVGAAADAARAVPTRDRGAGDHQRNQPPQQQQQPSQLVREVLVVEEHNEQPTTPPLPEPADLAAAAAAAAEAAKPAGPKKVAEPSVQVCMVDDKPVVCIDMGEGKPDLLAVEEKLLAEMQSITMKQGEAAAQQAQFIIVGADLPAQRTLSTINESSSSMLPMQQSDASGLAAAASAGTDAVGSPSASAAAVRSSSSRMQPASTAAERGARTSSGAGAGGEPHPAVSSSRGLGSAAVAGVGAAAAAASGGGGMPSPLRPIKVRPDSFNTAAAGAGGAGGGSAGGGSGKIDAYVRDASAADTHDKVQHWLKVGSGSTELPLEVQQQVQQQLELQQQQQQQTGFPQSLRQQRQEEQAALRAIQDQQQQKQQQPKPDVFNAEDSPFFLLPNCASSGSVELGVFKHTGGPANSSNQGGPEAVGSAQPGGFGASMPSFMDPNALDDSTLPAADGSGGALSEAPTIYYPEECSPAQALLQSTASIRSASITSSTAPTLWNMAGNVGGLTARSASNSGGQQQPSQRSSGRAPPGEASDSNPYSFTAMEYSPFARLPARQDDDAPLPAAGDDTPAAAGAGAGGGARWAPGTPGTGPLPQADSNNISAGPFGVQRTPPAGDDDGVVRDAGPFGGSAFGGGGGFGPALGAAGVNEDSIAPPLPEDGLSGAGGLQADTPAAAAAAAGAGNTGPLLRASPPPSPGPGSSRNSGAGSGTVQTGFGGGPGGQQQQHMMMGGQQQQQHMFMAQQHMGQQHMGQPQMMGGQQQHMMMGGQQQHMMMNQMGMPPASPKAYLHGGKGGVGGFPVGRISSSPRHASPAPTQQGVQGADVRRWSTSSKASSAAAGPAMPGAPAAGGGYPPYYDGMMPHQGGGFAGAGGAGAFDPGAAGPSGNVSAGAGAGPAGIQHKPLDDSVLNKNLRLALGRTATKDLAEDIDIVDMQQRDLEAWQSQNRNTTSARRSSNSSQPQQGPPAVGAGWHGPPGAGPVGAGFLPAEGLKGWVPGMVPPEAVLHQGGGGGGVSGGPPAPGMQQHPADAAGGVGPMQMQGWGADGMPPYGAGVGARGRIPSGADSSGSGANMGWGGGGPGAPGPGTSPPHSSTLALGGGYAAGGTMQTAAYMQMQAAAAANVTSQATQGGGGGGTWYPSNMHSAAGGYPPAAAAGPHGGGGVSISSHGPGGYMPQQYAQQQQQQYQQQQYMQQQQYAQQQYQQQYQQQQQQMQQQQYMYKQQQQQQQQQNRGI